MKQYRTILIDPPWPEHGGGKCKRGADRHYPLLRVDDIPRVIMTASSWHVAEDAHLYLWVTDNYLPDGIWVMRQLGFRYVRTLPWIKLKAGAFSAPLRELVCQLPREITSAELFERSLKFGLGQYFRGASELCLFGVKGDGFAVCTGDSDICNVIIGPRTAHSRKPEAAYRLIERRSLGPYLEMFARPPARVDWDVWGNEIEESQEERL